MNEYDSNRIFETVKKIGFRKTENLNEANCYLVNTSHIRDKAKEKVFNEIGRVKKNSVKEVILATSATVEGQTTAFYIQDAIKNLNVKISRLGQGIPIGGEIENLVLFSTGLAVHPRDLFIYSSVIVNLFISFNLGSIRSIRSIQFDLAN